MFSELPQIADTVETVDAHRKASDRSSVFVGLGPQSALTCDRFYGNGSPPAGACLPGWKAPGKSRCPAHIPFDFTAKASIAVGVDGLLLGRHLAWPQTPGLWWCKHRDRRDAEMENEAMATRQISKQAKTKATAKADTGVINKPARNGEREPETRKPRARSRSTAARIDQAGATAAVADGAVVHDKPEPTGSRSKPASGRTDVRAGSMSGANQPPASTKRAKLIAMLEQPEGASVAEIGQRLGWLPHTVRAAITGLRHAGRAVTRSMGADDRSVYRLTPVDPASQR